MKKFLSGWIAVLLLVLASCGLVEYDLLEEVKNDKHIERHDVVSEPEYEGYTPCNLLATGESVFEVPTLTSANVRLYFVNEEASPQWLPDYVLFDLEQVEHYHEFIHPNPWINERGSHMRIVFTTQVTVRNFKFLDIIWMDSSQIEGAEAHYLVRNVLYSLEELTPEIPFVVTGISLGCVLAREAFSFIDEDDELRVFPFGGGFQTLPFHVRQNSPWETQTPLR